MATSTGVAVTGKEDDLSGEELVEEARKKGNIENEDFGVLFTSTGIDFRKLVEQVDDEIDSEWVGGTTVAELSPEGFSEQTAVMMLVESDEILFTSRVSQDLSTGPEGASRQVMRDIENASDGGMENRLLFTLLPGFTQEKEGQEFKFLKGIEAELQEDMPVVGGSTGDGFDLKENYQIRNGEIFPNKAVVTLVETDHPIVTGQAHGFEKSIATGVVTDAEGQMLKQIKGEPAVDFYADAVGADSSELSKLFDMPLKSKLKSAVRYSILKILGRNPIVVHKVLNYSHNYAIGREISDGEYRIISPIYVENGGIKLLDEVREGQVIHVLEAESEKVVDAAGKSFESVEPEEVLMGILTDCGNRYVMLDEEEKDTEAEMMKENLGESFAGFYGEGEIGDGGIGMCTFVNQSVTGFVIRKE